MRLLILTQYFPPETGAPQNRLFSLALHLAKHGIDVSILTAMPNYPKMEVYQDYKGKFFSWEKSGPLTIYRSYIYVNQKANILVRILNYASFVLSSAIIGWLKVGKQDLIICESPPLFLGLTALFLKWKKRARLIFNVSDLWPESVEKLEIIRNKSLLRLAYKLEKYIYHKAILVSGQTKGIISNIETRFPEVNTFWLPNGIDFGQFDANAAGNDFRVKYQLSNDIFILLYAGILGHAQGLETVLEAAELLKANRNIKFILVGDGPERSQLIKLAKDWKLENIIFIPNQPRSEMPTIISACDAFIVPLKKLELFLGAIPSKLFEPLVMGKPIILGVDGEARELFIDQGNCGLFYEPENSTALVQCVDKFYNNKPLVRELGENGKRYIRESFDREKIATSFYCKISILIKDQRNEMH